MSIKLKGSSDGSVSFDAPADTSPSGSDITLTLPTSAGSANQFLKNSGIAGELEYSSMVEDSSGRLLVGTTSGGGVAKLQVQGSTLFNDAFLDLCYNGSGSIAADTNLGVLRFTDQASNANIFAQIACATDAAAGSGDYPGRLVFSTTADGAGSPTERMRIDSSGRVGINDTTPDARLDIGGDNADIRLGGSQYFRIKALSTGELTFNDNDVNERMRMTSGGCLVINGTSVVSRSQTVSFQVGEGSNSFGIQRANSVNVVECVTEVGTTTTRTAHLFKNPNGSVGSINIQSNSVTYNTSSDYRLKENIVDLDGAITRVKQLQPRRFNFISDDTTTVDGFVAHEAATVVPEAVTGAHNGVKVWEDGEELPDGVSVGDNKLDEEGNTIPVYQGIDQSKLVPLLTAALQEAIAKIETLETKVAALEAA